MKDFNKFNITSIDKQSQSKKRLFIGLICLTSGIVCFILFLLWLVPFLGLSNIHPYAPFLYGFIIFFIIAFVCWATIGLLINILLGRSIPFFKPISGLTIKLFLPLMTLVARLFGISKDKVRSSFIKVNNELVFATSKQFNNSELLLLLPHCLQSSKCKFRLTYSINNCKRCGECPVDGLISLSEKYSIKMAIATGGTIARRIIVNSRPKLIIAVACERDLASGIQDAYPIPVFGLMNERPHGPCLDTHVSLSSLENVISFFLKKLN